MDKKSPVGVGVVAMEDGMRVERKDHPAGAKGAAVSLEEVARRINKDSKSWKVRAWVGHVLVNAGKPTDTIVQAQAILDALRQKTMYAPDPVGTEMMVSAENTLCLDSQGACIKIGDCDDLTIALGAALMSSGIPIQIIGQSFDNSGIPSHVMLAIETKDGWKKIDPSHSSYRVGESYTATKEIWVDPLDSKSVIISENGQSGDFVGIGAIPIGVGELSTPNEAVYNAVTSQLQLAVKVLEKAVNELGDSLHLIDLTRTTLTPNQPFDPEPSFIISGVSDFPTDGLWTKNMAIISVQTWTVGNTLVKAGHEALNGIRKILVNEKTNEVFIESKSTDPWSMHEVIDKVTDAIIGFFSPIGELISGFTIKDGKALTKDEIQLEIAKVQSGRTQGLPVGVGVAPIVVIGGIVIATIAGIALYYVVGNLCDTIKAVARTAQNKAVIECVTSGKCSSAEGQKMLETISTGEAAIINAEANRSRNDPLANTASSVGTIVTWVVIGGIAAAGIYIAAPLLKQLVEETTSSRRSRALSTVRENPLSGPIRLKDGRWTHEVEALKHAVIRSDGNINTAFMMNLIDTMTPEAADRMVELGWANRPNNQILVMTRKGFAHGCMLTS